MVSQRKDSRRKTDVGPWGFPGLGHQPPGAVTIPAGGVAPRPQPQLRLVVNTFAGSGLGEHGMNRLLLHIGVEMPVASALLLGRVPGEVVDHPLVHATA